MEKKYDIFISYRRDGGESTAKILRDKLHELGYRVFFDVESLRSGDFNTRLYDVIDECDDFLLILSPGALDRCENEGDWVRNEIEHALNTNKNIIPIMLRGFSFPEKLPPAIDAVRYKNGLESNYQFFDAFIGKLQAFLKAKPALIRRVTGNHISRKLTPLIILLTILVIAGGAFILHSQFGIWKTYYPSTSKEKNLTTDLLYYVEGNLLLMEQTAGYMYDAYGLCERYLAHSGTTDHAQVESGLGEARLLIGKLNPEPYEYSESLEARLQGSPFSSADTRAMHDFLLLMTDSCIDRTYYMDYVTSDLSAMDTEAREELVSCYLGIMEETLKQAAYSTNQLLLPITDEETISAFKQDFLPQLCYIPLKATDWSEDEKALISAQESSMNAQDKLMERITLKIGNLNLDVMRQKDELIKSLTASGLTEEEAEKQVSGLIGETDDITVKLSEIKEMEKEIDAMKAEAALKFAPLETDDRDTLWGKMLRFMSLNMYDSAIECLNVYREAVRGTDEYAEIYLAAAVRFINNIGNTGIDYGVLVTAYDPDTGSHPVYEIGDVIISLNGAVIHNYEEYNAEKSGLTDASSFNAAVLRKDENDPSLLREVTLNIPADAPRIGLRDMCE